MNLTIVLPLISIFVGLCILTVGIINAAGKDHNEKRVNLIRAGLIAGTLMILGVGWLAVSWFLSWPNHDGDLHAKADAANEAKATHQDDDKVVHKPPVLEKPTQYLRHPTPSHIYKTIQDAPPAQMNKVAEQFVGAPVAWDGKVFDSYEAGGKTFVIFETPEPNPFPGKRPTNFSTALDLPKDSAFLHAKAGTLGHVRGILDAIHDDGFMVMLRDTTLELVDK